MRGLWWCGVLGMTVWLSGCGGGGRGLGAAGDPENLPVSCVAKPSRGHCGGRIEKYYFDYRDNRCKAFNYSGCGGRVPFETLEDCMSYCGASQ